MAKEQGTKDNPWIFKTPPLSSDFTMHKDVKDDKEIDMHSWYNPFALRRSLPGRP